MRKHECALLPVLGFTFLMVGCSGLMTEPSEPSDADGKATPPPQSTPEADGKPSSEEDKSTEDKVAEATLDEEEISYRDFPPDVLFALLSAELAAQRGRFDVTLVNYTQAAADTGDEGVIRRAMQIAQALNATNAQRQIAAIWLKANPDAPRPCASQPCVPCRTTSLRRHSSTWSASIPRAKSPSLTPWLSRPAP